MTTGARHWGQETGSGRASPRRGGGSRMEPLGDCAPAQGRVMPIRKDGIAKGLGLSSELPLTADAAPAGRRHECHRHLPPVTLVSPRDHLAGRFGARLFSGPHSNHDAGSSGQRRVLRGRANGLRGGGRPMRLPRGADRQSIEFRFGGMASHRGESRTAQSAWCRVLGSAEILRKTTGELVGHNELRRAGQTKGGVATPARQLFHQPIHDVRYGLPPYALHLAGRFGARLFSGVHFNHDAGSSGQRRVLRGRANGLRGGGRHCPPGVGRQSIQFRASGMASGPVPGSRTDGRGRCSAVACGSVRLCPPAREEAPGSGVVAMIPVHAEDPLVQPGTIVAVVPEKGSE